MLGYFIEENNMPIDSQKRRNELTSIRLGKVTKYLTKTKPSILPFKGTFPIISENALEGYMDEFNKEMLFKDLPRFLKNIVYKAEKIAYYTNQFEDFLQVQDISKKEFTNMNPKEKNNVLNSFLEEQQTDLSMLEIKDYE